MEEGLTKEDFQSMASPVNNTTLLEVAWGEDGTVCLQAHERAASLKIKDEAPLALQGLSRCKTRAWRGGARGVAVGV